MKKQSKKLGAKLKEYRETAKKQVEDTADAIELDAIKLVNIESGETELDEETLALLISLFKLDEEQAIELWTMAGYDTMGLEEINMPDNDDASDNKKEIRINLPADSKVLYTDMAQVMSNQYGVTLHFMQSAPGNNAMVVSRVGMSKEHAQSFVDMLQKNIDNL